MVLREERYRRILSWLEKDLSLSIDDLQDRLQVSTMTVWRDLDYLEKQGSLQRIRGGAMKKPGDAKVEPFFEFKQIILQDRKTAIACYAAEHFICENDILILEGGTTAASIIPYLPHLNLTIMTNGLDVLIRASQFLPRLSVMSCGGILRDKSRTFVGPQAEAFFSTVNAHKFILGATGIDLESGITDPSPLEIQVKQVMQKSADKTILLLDSSKFGVRSLAQIVPFQSVDVLVTDEYAPQEYVNEIRALGIEVHVVSLETKN